MSMSDKLNADIDLDCMPKNNLLREMNVLSRMFDSADKLCPVSGCGFGMAGTATCGPLHRVLSLVHIMQDHDVRLYDFGVGGGNVVGHANWVFGWVATGCDLKPDNVQKAQASLGSVAKTLSESAEDRCPSLIRRFKRMSSARRQPPPIDYLRACKENLGIMKARIAALRINTFFVFWAGWSFEDKEAVFQLFREAPSAGIFVIADFTTNANLCKELAESAGSQLIAAGKVIMAGSHTSCFAVMVFGKTRRAMIKAQQASEAQEAEDARLGKQGPLCNPAQTQEGEGGQRAGSPSTVRGSQAVALALLDTKTARKSRRMYNVRSPASLRTKPTARSRQKKEAEQTRKASLRAKAKAGLKKREPRQRKRVRTCGTCKNCVRPHWKKACLGNQQRAMAGAGAAAPGAGHQLHGNELLRGSKVLSTLPHSQGGRRQGQGQGQWEGCDQSQGQQQQQQLQQRRQQLQGQGKQGKEREKVVPRELSARHHKASRHPLPEEARDQPPQQREGTEAGASQKCPRTFVQMLETEAAEATAVAHTAKLAYQEACKLQEVWEVEQAELEAAEQDRAAARAQEDHIKETQQQDLREWESDQAHQLKEPEQLVKALEEALERAQMKANAL
ncbi:hypothetical protein DUNSADRAFT_16300 [Dunaliella salina]|uniref:DOT1 domain-containing protein n=1 Tax=Dunaliella salina TaxID=3046 RepID=A0ABQ7G3U9_DUNSA|nr:hypothetical protein DUNSADRAFT_16300 [Dunaliella salina]|eukprot:KAF5829280.1 hypothetical protein DUNSADRAFT_16300 [Dunaliella salina]